MNGETKKLILAHLKKIRADVEIIKDVQEDHGLQLAALNGHLDIVSGRIDILSRRVKRIERKIREKS